MCGLAIPASFLPLAYSEAASLLLEEVQVYREGRCKQQQPDVLLARSVAELDPEIVRVGEPLRMMPPTP